MLLARGARVERTQTLALAFRGTRRRAAQNPDRVYGLMTSTHPSPWVLEFGEGSASSAVEARRGRCIRHLEARVANNDGQHVVTLTTRSVAVRGNIDRAPTEAAASHERRPSLWGAEQHHREEEPVLSASSGMQNFHPPRRSGYGFFAVSWEQFRAPRAEV